MKDINQFFDKWAIEQFHKMTPLVVEATVPIEKFAHNLIMKFQCRVITLIRKSSLITYRKSHEFKPIRVHYLRLDQLLYYEKAL